MPRTKVHDAAAGRDFTVLVTKNTGLAQETEIYSAGVNLWGQLGHGELTECSDFDKIVTLSNLQYQSTSTSPVENVTVEKISCGLDHCIVYTNMGVMFEWGCNLKGQLGNKRVTNSENPIIIQNFKDRKVISLKCGQDSSAVVVEEDFQKTESSQPKPSS